MEWWNLVYSYVDESHSVTGQKNMYQMADVLISYTSEV